jgi:magnesium transporter
VVRQLLAHESDTAGGIMTPEFVLLSGNITADEAVAVTQRSLESETIAHLFVSDAQNRLLGHLPLHRLVFAHPDRKLRELYDPEVVTVMPETDQEEVVRLATHYGLDVVPVVSEEEELLGVITVDDILEAGREEADEDIYRLAGTTERDPVHATVLRSTRLRLPWLLITLVGGLCIAFLVSRFEATLEAVQIAFFIPLIPLMGGNVAIQASAIVVRGLAVGDIHAGRLLQFILKQGMVTIMLAGCCGVAAGVVGAFFPQVGTILPLVVGVAIAAAITLAGTLGTLLPLAFDRLGLDPAVSAGPFVTLLNDLLCITIYLSLGQLAIA